MNQHLFKIALLLGAFTFFTAPARADEGVVDSGATTWHHHDPFPLECGSHQYQLAVCPAGVRINTVQLLQQSSHAPCIFGRTWGFDQTNVWVDRGCRAFFEVTPDGDDAN